MMKGCDDVLVLSLYTEVQIYQIHSKSDTIILWMDKKRLINAQ